MDIPDQPSTTACASCGPLIWLYSARRGVWVAFIAVPAGGPHAITPHPCRHGQDPATWRSLAATPVPGQAGINAAGRARAVEALKPKDQTRTDNEEQR